MCIYVVQSETIAWNTIFELSIMIHEDFKNATYEL